MNVLEAIHSRRAVRAYTSEPVSEDVILDLIDAAIQAPNAMNRQAWVFLAVTDRAVLPRIASQAKAFMFASLEQTPALQPFRERLSQPEFDIFYGAPALVVICAAGADDMARHDCCLAAENMMLAAHAGGLGSCWIGFAEAWLATPEAKVELGLPEHAWPVAPIILGHPRNRPLSPGRRPAEIVWVR